MRSLRSRLTLGVTVVVAIVLVVAGTMVSRYVDTSERNALDDRLQRTAQLSQATALAAVEQQLPSADSRLDALLSATGTSVRLLLGSTELLNTGRPPPQHRIVDGLRTFTVKGKRYRSYTISVRDAGLGGLVKLEVTTALGQTEKRQRQLNRRLLYMGIAGLVVTALGTWLAAGGVLSPLRRLRRVTAQIAADEDLSHTVPQKGPREIKSVATSFNAMLARLSRSAADRERALAATRRFAADAGHELRTPLTAVQATLSSLARHPELDAERRTAMATDAMSEQRRLVDLLDGLQALARGDAEPGSDSDVDLGEVVAESVAREGGGEVDADLPEAPVVVRGWDAGLRVLTGNLIRNAVVHGGHVHVELVDGATPTLTVDDDGPGIPEEDRARIFEPFTRLDVGERPGSGLGLALVAQQARHHGADVSVAESPQGGARFVVTFPSRA